MSPTTRPEIEREVRFAVVIYGGVSLAVYINGVVQEMLRMVRATAVDSGLTHSELVYKKIACMLGLGLPTAKADEGADDLVAIHGGVGADGKIFASDNVLRTKFVVDILTGTSAGGINAIYLAKALANHQSLRELALMWINVADIGKLLNDKTSAEAPVRAQVPPKSLLNSRWMYLKLIQALDGMETSNGTEQLVEDLDLFSTATDLDGLALPIALADKQVFEFRHRNVFHFRKRGKNRNGQNDFTQDNNPFLAFAARCTSAFPFAFEPMALCDIFDIIQHLPAHRGQPYCAEDTNHWQKFYLEYIRDADPNATTEFHLRSFGDGGYLDNKPFSYAIDTIMTRSADIPVDRKLVYVEPSPEDVGKVEKKRTIAGDRPDAIQNSLAALVDLPRYETIREDLERVLQWNRNVTRIKRILRDAVRDLDKVDVATYKLGLAYNFYLRLRLSSTTDRVACQVADALKLDPNSARGDAIRGLAGTWRDLHVAPAEQTGFLSAYDGAYLERAIRFLRGRIRRKRMQAAKLSKEWQDVNVHANMLMLAQRKLRELSERDLPDLTRDPSANPEELRKKDQQRKDDLEFVVNPQFAAELRKTNPAIPEAALGVSDSAFAVRLRYMLERRGWDDAITAADKILRAHFSPLEAVRGDLTPIMEAYDGWDRFDVHDSVVFPVVFGTTLGEVEPVDIIRISPDDVADIAGVDDGRDTKEPKLKGQKFGAFGGFFDVRWRLHDMLRGRLHAAERLITALLPSCEPETAKIREGLIQEAQNAIAREWDETFSSFLPQENTKHATTSAR